MVNTHTYHLDSSYILLYLLYDIYIYLFTVLYNHIYRLSIPLFVFKD